MKLKAAIVSLILCLTTQVVLAGGDDPLVIIKDFKFIPAEITVKKGQTLTWENREKRQYHSVWFQALGEPEPEDYLFPEDTYEREFTETGSFPYRCGPHPEMRGTVHVTE